MLSALLLLAIGKCNYAQAAASEDDHELEATYYVDDTTTEASPRSKNVIDLIAEEPPPPPPERAAALQYEILPEPATPTWSELFPQWEHTTPDVRHYIKSTETMVSQVFLVHLQVFEYTPIPPGVTSYWGHTDRPPVHEQLFDAEQSNIRQGMERVSGPAPGDPYMATQYATNKVGRALMALAREQAENITLARCKDSPGCWSTIAWTNSESMGCPTEQMSKVEASLLQESPVDVMFGMRDHGESCLLKAQLGGEVDSQNKQLRKQIDNVNYYPQPCEVDCEGKSSRCVTYEEQIPSNFEDWSANKRHGNRTRTVTALKIAYLTARVYKKLQIHHYLQLNREAQVSALKAREASAMVAYGGGQWDMSVRGFEKSTYNIRDNRTVCVAYPAATMQAAITPLRLDHKLN